MISLQSLNTFGIPVVATSLVYLQSVEQAIHAVRKNGPDSLVLGGGSNVLMTEDLDHPLLVNRIKKIKVLEDNNQDILVQVGGGENWHQFVLWTIMNGYGGLENLSLIPGTVGAAPIQNIGAYGVEQDQLMESLEAVDKKSGQVIEFAKKDCDFSYRHSIFKQDCKDEYLITAVNYRLNKRHEVNISYGAIQEVLENSNISDPTIKDVSNAVISIRQSKLPDPRVIGNCGSFFKNPIVSSEQFLYLKEKYPEMPSYPVGEGRVKLAAGWLIDKGGWKGYRLGNVGTHPRQALVIVNHGGASGREIWNFAQDMIEKVKTKYDIILTPEVNVWY